MLAEQLAKHFDTIWVKEYAREYLHAINRPYDYSDILEIARNQLNNELILLPKANKYIFSDTDLIVTKIWCEVIYGNCHKWINENITKYKHDLYLLCDIDLPWVDDPLREQPDKRKYLFDLYKNVLIQNELVFGIVNGIGDKRLENAINIILNSLK